MISPNMSQKIYHQKIHKQYTGEYVEKGNLPTLLVDTATMENSVYAPLKTKKN